VFARDGVSPELLTGNVETWPSRPGIDRLIPLNPWPDSGGFAIVDTTFSIRPAS
jgi:hypothetical protein